MTRTITFGRHQFKLSNFFKFRPAYSSYSIVEGAVNQLSDHRGGTHRLGRKDFSHWKTHDLNAIHVSIDFSSSFTVRYIHRMPWFPLILNSKIEGLSLAGSFVGKGYTSNRIIEMKKYGEEVRGSYCLKSMPYIFLSIQTFIWLKGKKVT